MLTHTGLVASEWSQLDCCGNTVAHVAALRRSRSCLAKLLEAGCPTDVKNSAGWTIFEEALGARDWTTSRLIFDCSKGVRDQSAQKSDSLMSQAICTRTHCVQ